MARGPRSFFVFCAVDCDWAKLKGVVAQNSSAAVAKLAILRYKFKDLVFGVIDSVLDLKEALWRHSRKMIKHQHLRC